MGSEARDDKCLFCVYWSMWEDECVHPCCKRYGQYVKPDDAACGMFEREEGWGNGDKG